MLKEDGCSGQKFASDQDLSTKQEALRAAGCQVIRSEKETVTKREGRTELNRLLEFLRDGDTLVVTRIDRLARSMKDLQDIVDDLKGRGVALKATEQPIDTGTAAGNASLDMLGVFAEFETNLRRERQMEGIAAASRIEIMFGRLKDWRRVATRYDRYPTAFFSAVALAANIIFWL